MIHAKISRAPDNSIAEIHLSITSESLPNFLSLVNRALNCWDSAPKELKELGDMLTHGYITQDHTYHPINTKQNSDYYSPEEAAALMQICEELGQVKFGELLIGDRVELNKLLKAKLPTRTHKG
jgi:hypothetical protein